MTTKEQVKRERERHHKALAALAASLGVNNPDGLKLWKKLFIIEYRIHKVCEDYCNGLIDEDRMDKECGMAEVEVIKVFGCLPPHFVVNRDPRGYALKLSSDDNGNQAPTEFELVQDWGRNQILAPTID